MVSDPKPALDTVFARARLLFLAAAVGVGGGLAIAGSVDKTAGGVILVASWVFGVASLHRLGRAGG